VAVATLARRDTFPLVRAEAVTALVRTDEAKPVIEAALEDPAERVRAAAIRALGARGDIDAWPAVEARLRDDDEWPAVTNAAIELAERLCISSSVDALAGVLERVERPTPWEPNVASAGLAIRALAAIGTPDARAVLETARRSPVIGATAARALLEAPTCAIEAP
jgi:HEAT repeat protein